jgi:acetyl-CoA carboxylase biotin carboxylase subunit
VEHPITEQVVDFDLIREQILLASGQPISGEKRLPYLTTSISWRSRISSSFQKRRDTSWKLIGLKLV